MKRFIFMAVLMAVPVAGMAEGFVISGSVLVRQAGVLYIYLTDEEQFSIPLTGIREIRKDLKENRKQEIPFSFTDVPEGAYGIRLYVDTNGNGKLDRRLFGPSEPWGMSWQGEPGKGIPRFEDIAFFVKRNIGNILIDAR